MGKCGADPSDLIVNNDPPPLYFAKICLDDVLLAILEDMFYVNDG